MKWPQKLENKKSKIVQATERACCLWIAGGKPFSFPLMRRLFWLFGMEIPVQQICKNDTFSSWHGKPSLVPSSVSELSCDSGNTYGDAAISIPSFVFMVDCCNLGLGGLVLVFTVDPFQMVVKGQLSVGKENIRGMSLPYFRLLDDPPEILPLPLPDRFLPML